MMRPTEKYSGFLVIPLNKKLTGNLITLKRSAKKLLIVPWPAFPSSLANAAEKDLKATTARRILHTRNNFELNRFIVISYY